MRRATFLTLAAVTLTLTCRSWALEPPAADWPKWLGPNGSGISDETGLLDKWPTTGPERLWSVPVGKGYSSPVAVNGKVFIYTMVNKKDVLTCISEDGKEVWKKTYDTAFTGQYGCTRATPTVDGEFIYTYGGDGTLVSRKVADGESAWTVNVLKETGGSLLPWGDASSPVIVGDVIYVQGGNGGNVAVAVNKKDGKIAWKSEAKGEASYAAILPVENDGVKLLVVFGGKALYGMDQADGKTLWSFNWNTSYDVNAATPVYRDGTLFVTSGYGHGCMRVKIKGKTAEKLGEAKEPHSKFPAPILDGDHLYVNSEGTLVCLKWPEGTEVWQNKDTRLGVGGSFVRCGDKLIAMTENGVLELIQADPKGCKLVSKVPLFSGGDNWATPIIYRGRLYVKGPNELVCFNIKAK